MRRSLLMKVLLQVAVVVLWVAAGFGQTYITFDVPNSLQIFVTGMNINGVITGYYLAATTPEVYEGFQRDAAGIVTTFQVPGAIDTTPFGINDSGEIVGSFIDGNTHYNGFIRDAAGNFTIFDAGASTVSTSAVAINNVGQAAGNPVDSNEAFIRNTDGSITFFSPIGTSYISSVAGINSSGRIVGSYLANSTLNHGFIRYATGNFSYVNISGASHSGTQLAAINDAGTAAGNYSTDFRSYPCGHGFVRSNAGVITTFDAEPSGCGTWVASMNHSGVIAGSDSDSGGTHGFTRSVAGVITLFDVPGTNGQTFAKAINGPGQIAGTYQDTSGYNHCFLRNPK